MIWEEEGKPKWVGRVEYDEVVCDLDNGTTGHVSRDNTCTQIEVTQLSSMWTRVVDLDGTQPRARSGMVIQEDQDGDLGL